MPEVLSKILASSLLAKCHLELLLTLHRGDLPHTSFLWPLDQWENTHQLASLLAVYAEGCLTVMQALHHGWITHNSHAA